ncbi:MAG TPA: hypothetical protein VGB64_01270 [Actinomycetota bacterium]
MTDDDLRYRCNACGNLTRFDVTSRRRTRAFHHYTLGGDLAIEEEEILEREIEKVTCRWCGASDQIESIPPAEGAVR